MGHTIESGRGGTGDRPLASETARRVAIVTVAVAVVAVAAVAVGGVVATDTTTTATSNTTTTSTDSTTTESTTDSTTTDSTSTESTSTGSTTTETSTGTSTETTATESTATPTGSSHRYDGEVETTGSAPVENETVEALYNGTVVASDATNATGYYSFEVASGDVDSDPDTVTLRVRRNATQVQWTSGGYTRVNVTVQPVIGGQVDTAHDTAAVADSISTWNASASHPRTVFPPADTSFTETDDVGRFAVPVEPNVTYDVVYQQLDADGDSPVRDGSADLYLLNRTAVGGGDADVGSTTLPGAHPVNVTVVDDGGEPVANATVTLYHRPSDAPDTTAGPTVPTDANGSLGIDPDVVELVGNVTVVVEPPSDGPYVGTEYVRNLTVTGSRNVTVVLESSRINASGSVTLANRSAATADALDWHRTDGSDSVGNLTTSAGEYGVRLLENATYEVAYRQINLDGVRFPTDSSPDIYALDTLETGTSNVTRNYTLPDGYNLSVTVVDGDGNAVPNASVDVVHRNGDAHAFVRAPTDSGGRLVHPESDGPGVEVRGDVSVYVEPPRGTSLTSNGTSLGVTGATDLTVVLHEAVNVSGYVRDDDGAPVEGEMIAFWSPDEGGDLETWTNATGNFTGQSVANRSVHVSFRQVTAAGDHRASFETDGVPDIFAFREINASADRDLGRLDLPSADNVTISVVDENGDPVSDAAVDLAHRNNGSLAFARRFTPSDGNVSFEGSGTVDVYVDAPDGSGLGDGSTRLEVTGPDHVEVVLASTSTVTGRFEYADATPAAGWQADVFEIGGTAGDHAPTNGTGNFTARVAENRTYGVGFRQENDQRDTQFPKDDRPDLHLHEALNVSTGDTSVGTIRLPDPHLVNVTVARTDGTPVTNATVFVGHEDPDSEGVLVAEARLDSDGTVWLQGAAAPGVEVNRSLSVAVEPEDPDLVANLTRFAADADRDVTVTVRTAGHLAVAINGTNSPVTEGETLDVEARVENTGETATSQTVELVVGESVRDSRNVSLDGGNATTVALSWATADGDAGDYTATVATDDDSAATGVTVRTPANFSVATDGTNSPVVEGETLNATATVQNTGDAAGTQTVELDVGGTVRDSTTVSLDGGNATTVALSWTTQAGDAGNYTATVASENDSAATGVTVQAPPNFSVALDGTNSPVLAGETLNVTATIANTGDLTGTQTVEFGVGGTVRDSATVSLDGGNATTATFAWTTRTGDGGGYSATVASDDDSGSTGVAVDPVLSDPVDSCGAITSAGVYGLSGDVTDGIASRCIRITSSDVVLDGQGHTIDLSGSGPAVNVTSPGSISNVTVRNLTVEGGGGFAVHARDDGATVVDVAMSNNRLNGTTDGVVVSVDGNESTLDVAIEGNRIANTSNESLDIVADGDDSDVRVSITGNHIDASGAGIRDIDAAGTNSSLVVGIVGNRITSRADDAIQDVRADADNQTVDVVIADNVLAGSGHGIEDVDANGDDTEATVSIRNNTIDAGSDGIDDVDVDGVGTRASVSLVDNTIDAGTDAIEDVEADRNDQVVDVEIRKNTLTAGDDGIEDVDTHGTGTDATVSIVDNTIDAGNDAIDDVDAYGSEGTVDLVLADNDLTAGDDGIEDIEVDGTGSRANVSLVNNTITSSREGIDDVYADGSDSTVQLVVAENTITAGADGIERVDVDGSNQTVDVRIRGNRITGFSDYGLKFDDVQLLDANRFDVVVETNHIEGNGSSAGGIWIDPDAGTGSPAGALVVENNEVRTNGSAVDVSTGPVAGIEIHDNYLAGDDFGVANQNTTAGSYVNATNNYWDASDGPGSASPYEDPVTGVLADGAGSAVTNATGSVANVHFDPFLTTDPTANVSVALEGTNGPVVAGETLVVDATLANTGELERTRTVELAVNGTVRDERDVTLGGGGTTSVALSWATADGDAGDYTATVASANDSASTGVTVLEPANLTVTLDGTNAPVLEGEPLNVSATIENTGGATATRTTELVVGDAVRDSRNVTLGGGEKTSVTLSWATEGGDVGDYTAVVGDNDAHAVAEVAVLPRTFSTGIDLQTGRASVDTSRSGSAVSEVSVGLPVGSSGNVSVEVEASPPAGASEPPGEPVTLVDITVPSELENEESTVGLRVSRTAIDRAGTTPEELRIARYNETGAVWEIYEANVTNTSAETVTVAATTPGFSAFSVTGESSSGSQEQTRMEPDISIAPNTVDFEEVAVGSSSGASVTVENVGDDDLRVSGVGVDGDDAGEFSDDAGSFVLAPGEDRTVGVTFAPTEAGTASASLVVDSNDPNEGTVEVSLSGEGVVEPDISVSPTSVDFGDATVGERANATVTVANDGTGRLSVDGLRVEGDNAGRFATDAGSFVLGADEERAVPVTFQPAEPGEASASLAVDSDDPDEGTVRVSLSGTGQGDPVALVRPMAVDFGNVSVGDRANATVRVLNDGTGPLAVEGPRVGGVRPEPFTVDNASFVLAPGEERSLGVTFEPTGTGAAGARATVRTNDTDAPERTVRLRGTGIDSDLRVRPAAVDFGSTATGRTATRTLTLVNDGSAAVTVTDLRVAGAGADDFAADAPTPPFVLAPGEDRPVDVTFDPTGGGATTARFAVAANDSTTTPTVRLSGVGRVPAIRTTPDSLNFGNVTRGATATRTVAVANAGNATLNVTDVDVVGVDASAYEVPSDGFSLAPGESRRIEVSFAPTTNGTKFATLRLSSTDPARPTVDVWLSNTATVVRTETSARENETTVNATLSNVRANETVPMNVSRPETAEDDFSLDTVDVTLNTDANVTVNLTTSEAPLDSTPAEELPDAAVGVGYLRVDHDVDDRNVTGAAVTFRVSKASLEAESTDPEDVSLYRYKDGQWHELPTEVVGTTDTHVRLRAVLPGFSDFGAGAKQPDFELADAEVGLSTITEGESVDIQVRIVNRGGASGTYTSQLLLNGDVVETKRVTVAPNGTRQVVFERRFDQTGTYEVQVDNVSVGELEVNEDGVTSPVDDGADSDSLPVPLIGIAGVLVAVLVLGVVVARRSRE